MSTFLITDTRRQNIVLNFPLSFELRFLEMAPKLPHISRYKNWAICQHEQTFSRSRMQEMSMELFSR